MNSNWGGRFELDGPAWNARLDEPGEGSIRVWEFVVSKPKIVRRYGAASDTRHS